MQVKLNDIVMVTEKRQEVGRVWFGMVSQIIGDEILVVAFRAKYGADVHKESSILFHFSPHFNEFVVLGNYKFFGG